MTRDELAILLTRFGQARLRAPATPELVLAAERTLGYRLPEGYRRFVLAHANGAQLDRLALLPVFDVADARSTDSVQRANDPAHTTWFDRDESTLATFCVVATMGPVCFALPVDADADAQVWMWECGADALVELDDDFDGFLLASADDLPG